MSTSLFAVAFDCADAAALARFWADVLGRQVDEERRQLAVSSSVVQCGAAIPLSGAVAVRGSPTGRDYNQHAKQW